MRTCGMRMLKPGLTALAVVVALAMPVAGEAASVKTPADGVLGTLDATTPSAGASRVNMSAAEGIDDSFSFIIDGGTAGGLFTMVGAAFVNQLFNIDDFAFEVLDAGDAIVLADSVALMGQLSESGFLPNGNYTLNITGTSTIQGTSYAASVNTSVVPLPPAVMMFGAALAALGLFGTRRATSSSA